VFQYHFPDDVEQIWQLMRPVPAKGDTGEQTGMSEEAAAYAVLGADIDGMTSAVARHFGLTDDVLHMIRRLPLDEPVRTPDGDADLLRAAASAANEVVDAVWQLAAPKLPQTIDASAKRYNRALGIAARDVNDALPIARQALAGGTSGGECGRRRRGERCSIGCADVNTTTPARLGCFKLRRVLGKGAQATVWLAFDLRLEREVDVKLLGPAGDATAVGDSLHEARNVSRLTHPHVVPVSEADAAKARRHRVAGQGTDAAAQSGGDGFKQSA
jgi:hypothetical protein